MRNILLFLFLCSSSLIRSTNEIVAYKLYERHNLPVRNIRSIKQDKVGYIYLISPEATYQFDGYTFRRMSESEMEHLQCQESSISYSAHTRFTDNLGNVVERHPNGELVYHDHASGKKHTLKVFDANQYQHLTKELKINVITDIRGYVWISVNGNGVFVYDKEARQLQHFSEDDPQPMINSNYITSMLQDRGGNIWVTGGRNCVTCLKVSPNPYHTMYLYKDARNEKQKEVRMITRLADDRLVLGNKFGEVFESTDELQTLNRLYTDGDIYISAAIDSQGRLWLGSRQGGVSVDGIHYGKHRTDCILPDQDGRVWTCGVEGCLYLSSLDSIGNYREQAFLRHIPHLAPRAMIQDKRNHRIYVCSEQGLISFMPDKLLADSTAYNILITKPIICALEDSSHTLWLGTAGDGIYYKKQGSEVFNHLTTSEGLISNYIQCLAESKDHHICVGTMDGYSCINPQNDTSYNFRFGNSVDRNFMNENSIVLLRSGEIAMGTVDGIVVYNPGYKNTPTQAIPLTITGAEIDGAGIEQVRDGFEHLSYNQNSITVLYSNFDYGNASHTYYTYYMEGYDRKWSKPSTDNFASYKHLPTGRYTLHVRCRNATGDWNPAVQKIKIHISPPLWATWWAYLSYLMVSGGICFVIFRQMKRSNALKQKVQLEKEMTNYKLRFFTNISHEFRTPLTLIRTSMDRLMEVEGLPGAMKQPLSNMQRSVTRMSRLIDQLLEFRRMQNGKLSLSLQETDIVRFLRDIYSTFFDLAGVKDIDYQFVPAERSMLLYIDRGHVDKVVYNLLSNAFKYTPDHGCIRLTAKKENDYLIIEVIDSGIGIPKERQATIFDRFETGKVDAGSIGIGLNLAKELMQVHHGRISFHENPTGGSIFSIELPVDAGVYAETDFLQADKTWNEKVKGSTVAPYQELQFEPMNNRRILLVEDDSEIRNTLGQELGRYLSVDSAADGSEAWELMQDNPYDLVVSDIRMPVMNGYELLRKIRKSEAYRQTPVILLTAMCSDDKVERGLDEGADAYIPKPFSFRVLLSQCYNLIRQRDTLKQVYGNTATEKVVMTALIKDERDKKILEQIDAMIDIHLGDETFDIDTLATLFNQARTSFFNKFKALTGKSPNEYLKEKRLEKSVALLKEGQWTVAEVACKVGIPNAQYFSTCFKKKYGISPKAYQRGEG